MRLLFPAFALMFGVAGLVQREEPVVWPLVATAVSAGLCLIFYWRFIF
jgi:hypothetical protein